ncbi:restriction endonuclease subunit S [Aureliella helgolandensis]|uniref:EcoKI restriction-modification system protein HsdS n=1 Tax=Aureliella helgolandensis TaxID=2527968 RepID=A0A518GBV0_9BACT|nr:restriction endonuclease subunit S [Aureliella helgolandensis]QDV26043.1 EcoKI restriction-modification system protein HsdS [Aureliella helgolandensis]
MVPEGWIRTRIGDTNVVTSGGTPSRNVEAYWGGCIPWVTTGAIDFNIITQADEYITDDGLANSSAKLFPRRTLLVGLYGDGVTRGKVAMLGIEAATNQACAAILPSDSVLQEYLFYYIAFHYEQLRRLSSDGNQKNLSGGLIRSFPLLSPSLPEQEEIVSVFVTMDRLITLSERLISAKQKRKQALMQQLLTGEIRLQAFTNRRTKKPSHVVRVPAALRRGIYPPSVQPGIPKLIEKPDGWDEKTMAELLKTKKRRVQLDDDTEYDLVVAKRNRGGIEPRGKLRGEEIRTSSQFKVKAGDFVISRRQIIHGACGIVPASLDGAIVSNEYSVFTVNKHLDPGYLRLLSHSLYFQQTCFHSSVGVAVEKMIFKVEQWLKYPFLLPPVEEQRAITKTLETAEAEIALLKQRVKKLKQQKKGLMQQMLTGKTRVKLPKGAA